MKTWEDYLNLPYRMELVEDTEEGGFVVSFPELPGCITCGETIEAAIRNAKDAKRAWLQAAQENEIPIPKPNELQRYSGQFKLRLPKSLHKQLAEEARQEGISMNQYCVFLLSRNGTLQQK